MSRADGKRLKRAPILEAAGVIIDMVVLHKPLFPRPGAVPAVVRIQLVVEGRHLRVEDEVRVLVGVRKALPVKHGVFLEAHHILHQ